MVATGDGSVKLFDIGLDEFPIRSWKEHNREVFAVHWNLVAKDTFCSSSWDGTIKVVRTPLLNVLRVSTNGLCHSGLPHAKPPSLPSQPTHAPTLHPFRLTTPLSFLPSHPTPTSVSSISVPHPLLPIISCSLSLSTPPEQLPRIPLISTSAPPAALFLLTKLLPTIGINTDRI